MAWTPRGVAAASRSTPQSSHGNATCAVARGSCWKWTAKSGAAQNASAIATDQARPSCNARANR